MLHHCGRERVKGSVFADCNGSRIKVILMITFANFDRRNYCCQFKITFKECEIMGYPLLLNPLL